MRKFLVASAGVLLLVPAVAQAGETDDFYGRLLQRGIASVQSSNYEAATRELRIAAFGLVNSVDAFQTAHVYLAVAASRAHLEAEARQSALRVVAAERIDPHYSSITVPSPIRTEFETIAVRLLTDQQRAVLRGNPQREELAAAPGAVTAIPEPPKVVSTAPATLPAIEPAAQKPPVATPAPPRPQASTPRTASATDLSAALTNAERTLSRNDLPAARQQYRKLIDEPAIDHALALRLVEGLYRARDFAGTLRAFTRIGTLQKGEEHFRYYRAVALFETGDVQGARAELAAALPHIEVTPDVAQYRARIDAAARK